MKNNKKYIAFIVPYPYGIAPGQRFRFEQYLDILKQSGFEYKIFPFIDFSTYTILYQKGHFIKKVFTILWGYVRRFMTLFRLGSVDYIFIYREATPLGMPFFEWIVTHILNKKLIYDFDDAIWMPATSQQNRLVAWLKYPSKVQKICQWSYKVSVGNDFLAKHATKFVSNDKKVCLNPTTIDTVGLHQGTKNQLEKPLTIGWTGSHSTLSYLPEILPVIRELEKTYTFTFRVICNQNPELELESFEFVKWNKKTEIQDLMTFHIGLMPLKQDAWSSGKCGFKALQYMALGIPAVASPVGVNKRTVEDGKHGYLCQTPTEWYQALEKLLQDPNLRTKLGQNGQEKVKKLYSVHSNTENFLSLFD